jgi:cell wall-associated NlpC family hydrolase
MSISTIDILDAQRTAQEVPGWIQRPVDRDMSHFELAGVGHVAELTEAIVGGNIVESMAGALALTISVDDAKRSLINNGILTDWVVFNPLLTGPHVSSHRKKYNWGAAQWKDIYAQLDFRYLALAGVKKNANQFDLVFENRAVTELRKFNTYKIWNRAQYTRAEAIQAMVNEAIQGTGFNIPFFCPELKVVQPIATSTGLPSGSQNTSVLGSGFAPGAAITVKGHPASAQQKSYISQVLATGISMGAGKLTLISAIMTITQESDVSIDTNPSAMGLFDQNPADGWPATGTNIPADAGAYFKAAIANIRSNPLMSPGELAQSVQNSAFPTAYDQWQNEATATVNAYTGSSGGVTPGTQAPPSGSGTGTAGEFNSYAFTRGQNGNPENSWVCMQRLASEVSWFCFMLDNTLYYVEDDQMMAQQPTDTISENDDGIDQIDYNIDVGKPVSEVTVRCHEDRWLSPAGSLVEIENEGPINGRWIVYQVTWPLFGNQIEVDLQLPTPPKPEPAASTSASTNQPGSTPAGSGNLNAVVQAAMSALSFRPPGGYSQARPFPSSLAACAQTATDCSGFAILCYKQAGMPDPSGNNYDGQGFTGDMTTHGHQTQTPQPGDLAFWLSPDHVAVYIGNGNIIEWGAPPGPIQFTVSGENAYHSSFQGYWTYVTSPPSTPVVGFGQRP